MTDRPSPDEALWIDGPGLYRWLLVRYPGLDKRPGASGRGERKVPAAVTSSDLRRLREWREPRALADVYAVDRVLIHLDLHLSSVPDELFVSPRANGKVSDEERAEAVRRKRAGESAHALALDYGVSPSSIYKWAAE